MEANPTVPPLPIDKPIWKKPWFWWITAGAAGCFGFLALFVLATFLVPNVVQKFQFTSRKKAEADIVAIQSALTEYSVANGGKYPESLEALVTPDVHGWTYLNAMHVPKDPWGRTYVYEPPGPGNPRPRIFTLGKDGKPGGEGDSADIDSSSVDRAR
jgi:general secretion pathway protein G